MLNHRLSSHNNSVISWVTDQAITVWSRSLSPRVSRWHRSSLWQYHSDIILLLLWFPSSLRTKDQDNGPLHCHCHCHCHCHYWADQVFLFALLCVNDSRPRRTVSSCAWLTVRYRLSQREHVSFFWLLFLPPPHKNAQWTQSRHPLLAP
jgi:hypothetical protein